MFFRKRIRVPDFLEGRAGDLLNVDRSFILEDFYDEYTEIYIRSGRKQPSMGNEGHKPLGVDRDLFLNRFIGALLWLIKYRTLGSLFNSPRKLAYLDLTFDTAMPEVVNKSFLLYDTRIINDTYDAMDISCKKAYTGELLKGDKPRFLISPLWARDADPHPFRVAAKLFAQMVERDQSAEVQDGAAYEAFIDLLEGRFNEMTQKAADVAKGLNIT